MSELMHGQIVEATIESHHYDERGQNDTPCIVLHTAVMDERVSVTIWMTEKSMNIAKKQLKECGFDAQAHSIMELDENRHLLAGNKVEIEIEVNGNYVNGKIPLGSAKLEKSTASKLDALLRAGGDDTPAGEIPF